MKSLLDFIKYNNAFPIMLSVIILGTGAAFAASPDLRQAVFLPSGNSPVIVEPKKTDATLLLSMDTDTFNPSLRIDAIVEDTDVYRVTYSYTTLEVSSGEWRKVRKTESMDAWKSMLGGRDLRAYVTEQLSQVIARELNYLSEAKRTAMPKDTPRNSEEYASLIGTEINARVQVEDGKRVASDDGKSVSVSRKSRPSGAIPTKEEINAMVVKAVADFLAIDMSMPEFPTETSALDGSTPESIIREQATELDP